MSEFGNPQAGIFNGLVWFWATQTHPCARGRLPVHTRSLHSWRRLRGGVQGVVEVGYRRSCRWS